MGKVMGRYGVLGSVLDTSNVFQSQYVAVRCVEECDGHTL